MDNQWKLEELQGTICRLSEENARLYQAYINEPKKVNEVSEQNPEQPNRIDELEKILAMLIDEKEKLLKDMEIVEKRLCDEEREANKHGKAMAVARTLKERESNGDELNEARKELINVLETLASVAVSSSKPGAMEISVKRLGNLDFMPFFQAMERAGHKKPDAMFMASDLCAKWEKRIREPHWYPFKTVTINGNPVEIIDEDEENLKALLEDMGEGVYKTVTTALTERKDYNPRGQRNVVQELWNVGENRKATLKEGIAFIADRYLEKDVQGSHIKKRRSA